jgi:hypothetical protein
MSLCLVGHIEGDGKQMGRSPKRSVIAWGFRAEATTWSPRANAFSTIKAPKPRDAPVMNQVRMGTSLLACIALIGE